MIPELGLGRWCWPACHDFAMSFRAGFKEKNGSVSYRCREKVEFLRRGIAALRERCFMACNKGHLGIIADRTD